MTQWHKPSKKCYVFIFVYKTQLVFVQAVTSPQTRQTSKNVKESKSGIECASNMHSVQLESHTTASQLNISLKQSEKSVVRIGIA